MIVYRKYNDEKSFKIPLVELSLGILIIFLRCGFELCIELFYICLCLFKHFGTHFILQGVGKAYYPPLLAIKAF